MKDEKGFSLVEVLGSLVIITIILISFFQLFVNSNKIAVTNNEKLVLVYLADAELERLVGNGIDITLAPEWFLFDVNGTVEAYMNKVNKPWYAFWESEPLIQMSLLVNLNEDLKNELQKSSHLNLEETMSNIKISAGNLSLEPIESVIIDISILESERLAFSLVPVSSDLVGLNEIIELFNETVLTSDKVISFNDFFHEDIMTYHDKTADFVASALYSTLLNTNFEIIERHSHSIIPSYLEPGIEASVDIGGKKDLKFLNNNVSPVILKMSLKESDLLVELYSIPLDLTAKYEVVEKVVVNPRTIYRYSADLNIGQEELIQEGKPGLRVTVLRTISEKKGSFEKQEEISRDYYPPVHRIIVKSIETSPELSDTDKLEGNDLNGDGLPDMNNTEEVSSGSSTDQNDRTESQDGEKSEIEDLDSLPAGSYYDKAGNIIVPE